MVWWTNRPDARLVKGASTQTQDCGNCDNRTEHVLFKVKSGAGVGNMFTGRMWVSTKTEWLLVCPICETGLVVEKNLAMQLQSKPRSRPTPKPSTIDPSSPSFCSSCKTSLMPNANFCGNCGTRQSNLKQ